MTDTSRWVRDYSGGREHPTPSRAATVGLGVLLVAWLAGSLSLYLAAQYAAFNLGDPQGLTISQQTNQASLLRLAIAVFVGTPVLGLLVAIGAKHRTFRWTFGVGFLVSLLIVLPAISSPSFRTEIKGPVSPVATVAPIGPRCLASGGFSDCP